MNLTQNDSDLPSIVEPANRPQRGMLSLLNLDTNKVIILHRDEAPDKLIHNYTRYYYHGTMDGIAQYTTKETT